MERAGAPSRWREPRQQAPAARRCSGIMRRNRSFGGTAAATARARAPSPGGRHHALRFALLDQDLEHLGARSGSAFFFFFFFFFFSALQSRPWPWPADGASRRGHGPEHQVAVHLAEQWWSGSRMPLPGVEGAEGADDANGEAGLASTGLVLEDLPRRRGSRPRW